MIWRDIKTLVNNMSEEELERVVKFRNQDLSSSGIVEEISVETENLYPLSSDECSELINLYDLKQTYSENELSLFEPYIENGEITIKI